MLELRLFGGFDVRGPDGPIALTSVRAQSLIAYLTLRRDLPQRRDHLAFLLWPDSEEPQARTNLRHLLHTVRSTIPDVDAHLRVDVRTLVWRGGWDDVAAFAAALDLASAPQTSDDAAAGALAEAVGLYTGDLLDGWYDDWVVPLREDLRRGALAALARLALLAEARRDLGSALDCVIRARAIDPLDEATYRTLMRLHDLRGDRARAVRVYHECVAVLGQELGVDPSDQTRAAYEALLPEVEGPGVKGANDAESAHEADGAPPPGGRVPLVGRGMERHLLTSLWRQARAGRAQLVVITGEPGLGKTRLVEELRQWAARQGAVTATARSYPAEGALPYAPVVAWLSEPGVVRRRAALGASHRTALGALLPVLRTATDLEPGESARHGPGSRLQLFDAVARALLGGTEPVLLVADDLHAADPPTLQLLHYLLRAQPEAPLLVLATARPAETDAGHPLLDLIAGAHALDRCTEVELARLDRVETGSLAEQLGHALTPVERDRLHRQTAGNPLFVVEALRAGWPGRDARGVLTPKVQAVIEAGFRRVGETARDLLGIAATAGSAVSVEVLLACRPGDDVQVARDLDELWRCRLIVTVGADTYDLGHDLLREVVRHGLSPARRRDNHRLLARALEQANAENTDDVAGRIASHLHEGGAAEQAVAWYVRAAVAAQRLYADAEAADLLHQAWDVVRSRTPSPRRQARELEILTAMPGPLAAAHGYASLRLAAVLDRAFEISAGLGQPAAAPLVRARAMVVLTRNDFDGALALGAELEAHGASDDVLAVEGAFVQGVAASWSGDLDVARRHLEQAIARYLPKNRTAHLLAFGQDPQVLCLIRLALVMASQGDPDGARRHRDLALQLARDVAHPFTLAGALIFAALLDLDLDPALAEQVPLRERVAELAGLGDRVEAPPIRLTTSSLAALVDVLDGRVDEGLADIDAALDDPAITTAPGLRAMQLRVRLAAASWAGRSDVARESATWLLADDVRFWDARARATLAAHR